MKEEGQIYKNLPQIFLFLPREFMILPKDLLMSLVMILPRFFDLERP